MLSSYQLKIAYFYDILFDNVKKLVQNVFDKEKYLLKINRVLEFNQSQWLKPYVEFNTRKRIETRENGDKDGKALYKLMNNVVYGKTMKNLRNRVVNNKKDYLKWTSKPTYMSLKIFDYDLVAIHKSKVTLKLNKPTHVEMCILNLRKALMYEFHYG